MFGKSAQPANASTDEQFIAIGTDHEFLEEAYKRCLGRSADPEGMFYFLQKLASREMSRENVVAFLRGTRGG